jgi:hypothetical protein
MLPPGVELSEKDLVPKNFGATSIMYKVVCRSILKQLAFLEEAQFCPSPEVANAYFRMWNITEWNEEQNEIAGKQLIENYTPQLKQTFEKGRSDKLRMLAICLVGVVKRQFNELKHQSVLRRLINHGLGWETPGYDNALRVILIDCNMKVSAADNNDLDYDYLGTNENSLECLEVVYKEEVLQYLETIIRLCETSHAGRELTDGNIMGLTILAKCLLSKWNREKPLSLKDYSLIEGRIMWDLHEGWTDSDKLTDDVDYTTLMMVDTFHESVRHFRQLTNRIVKPGYQSLLEWMTIERFVLSMKYYGAEVSTSTAAQPCGGANGV